MVQDTYVWVEEMLCKKVDKVWRLQVPWSLPNELLTGPTFYFYFVFIFPDLNQLLFLCRDITVYWKGLGCAQETYCLQKQVTSSLSVCSTKHFASWYGRNNFSSKGKNGIGWVIFLRIPLWLSAGWRHRFSPCLWNQKLMQQHRDYFSTVIASSSWSHASKQQTPTGSVCSGTHLHPRTYPLVA